LAGVPSRVVISLSLSLSVGCASPGLAELEDGEWLPGGDATNTMLLGRNAFIFPAPNLEPDTESEFFLGNSFFNQAWVEAPASTVTRDGLGPLFHARSCSGCHFRDGRANAPAANGEVLGALVRLSVGGGESFTPEPTYGTQFQDRALPDVPSEGTLNVQWEEVSGVYDDGTAYSLRRPTFSLDQLAYGPLANDTRTSLRVAPQMIGLGLLEGIPAMGLQQLEDPDDSDDDGISGVISRVVDAQSGEAAIGRFGWKGEQPSTRTQSAAAFSGDLGITSDLFPNEGCTEMQAECLNQPDGGTPELEPHLLDAVAVYSAALAVPVRRNWEEEEVLIGKRVFGDLACGTCHTPTWQTDTSAPLAELVNQTIWPYTDLLLHDMGPDLADQRPLPNATGSEWRTPPLWGLGLIPTVNQHDSLLHDGRARGFAEAILWHGGEGEASRDAFAALPATEREALVRFLGSL